MSIGCFLKRLAVCSCLGLALSAAAVSQTSRSLEWVTGAIEAPGVTYHEFESEAADGAVSYHLYKPPGYDSDERRRLPVVYWLHGSGGGLRGIAPVARQFDAAIRSGEAPPFLAVFVNGLRFGMYVDWKDGSAPIETIIVKDLVSHVDSAYHTMPSCRGRMLDGFSMGGYGAARLGFKFPEIFCNVSIVGAGPLQETLDRTPRASGVQASELLRDVYGGDPAYFQEVSPRHQAASNAALIARTSRVRMIIGDQDETLGNNEAFHEDLLRFRIPHEWIVVEGVGHDPLRVMRSLGTRYWAFYRSAFGLTVAQ
ncbi:MAG: esterase family protein [Alphaproteobacteria bacterium]|nr:esterase family protein [Alphaproteobacteria bacterium]